MRYRLSEDDLQSRTPGPGAEPGGELVAFGLCHVASVVQPHKGCGLAAERGHADVFDGREERGRFAGGL